ncbi:MAG: hypothetical protein ABIJ84_03825, partial [bacterium]
RVGTTALSVVFAGAGIEAHMQPIKSARRARQTGEDVVSWNIGVKKEKFAVAKETFGPHDQTEFFNPLEILLNLGYPKDKLILIPIVRDPTQTFSSWKEKWGVAKINRLVRAYELTVKIRNMAEQEGIFVFPYVHEAIKENHSAAVVAMLFEKLGLSMRQLSLALSVKWGELKRIENVFLYDAPPEKFIADIEKRGRYEYRDRSVSEGDKRLVESTPRLRAIYEAFYESSEANLSLKAMC